MISLTTDSGEEIRYDEIYGTMRFYAADTKENWVTERVMSAHIRGGSSRLNPKKSYKMTLYRQDVYKRQLSHTSVSISRGR